MNIDIRNIKKIIIIVIIIIVVLSMILVASLWGKGKDNSNVVEESEAVDDDTIDYSSVTVENVNDNLSFYAVTECVQQYLDIVNANDPNYYGYSDNGQYTKIIDDKYIKGRMYNILSQEYKNNNKITLDNIYNYVEKIDDKVIFIPIEMNELKGENSNKYLVYGFIEDTLYNYKKDLYVFVNLDDMNETFSIEPIIRNEKKNIRDIEINNENKEIEKNDDNEYISPEITEEYIAKQYFERYKSMILANPELAYKYLNAEYREKRFKNYEGFENYIKINADRIVQIDLRKYLVNNKGNYSEYVCLDQNEDYYIFNEKGGVSFEAILDTYTLDTEDFLRKYESGDEKKRSGMNAQKFFEALNTKDYNYAYSKLADSFKNNNFKKQEDFESFIKDNLFEHNYITYKNYNIQGQLNVFEVVVSDSKENGKQKNMTVIVKLEESTDFVISFSIE